MDYTLVRSNRKTVAIQLQKDGRVVVRAPKRLAVYRIEAFVKEKQGWIEQHQKRLQESYRKQIGYLKHRNLVIRRSAMQHPLLAEGC